MSDQIFLVGMEFMGQHGVTDEERAEPQTIIVDVEMTVDLRAAGTSDDLDLTVDYGKAFDRCRAIVEERSFHLVEGIAEAIAADLIDSFARIESVVVRINKPSAPIEGVFENAGVQIERRRG